MFFFYFCRFIISPSGYEDALAGCTREGESLIKIDHLPAALLAYQNSDLPNGIRLDAVANETCFKDQQGNTVDLESQTFALDILLPDQTFGLAADERDGVLSPAVEDEVLSTVCQFPVAGPTSEKGSSLGPATPVVGPTTEEAFDPTGNDETQQPDDATPEETTTIVPPIPQTIIDTTEPAGPTPARP